MVPFPFCQWLWFPSRVRWPAPGGWPWGVGSGLGRESLICIPSMPLVCVLIPLCLLTADSLPPCRGRVGWGVLLTHWWWRVSGLCEKGGGMSTQPTCPSCSSALPPLSHSELLCGSVGVSEGGVHPRQAEACQHLYLIVEFVSNGNAVWKGQEPATSCLWWTKGFCLPQRTSLPATGTKSLGAGLRWDV